jgi:hypothetical protein
VNEVYSIRRMAIPVLTLHLLACGGAQSETQPHNSTGGGTATGGMTAQLASSTETSTVIRGGTSGTSVVSSGGIENAGGSATVTSFGGIGGAPRTTLTTTGGGSTSTTTLTTPAECLASVPTGVTLPQVITFQFTNSGNAPKYLSNGNACAIMPKIQSCGDGYQAAIQTAGGCAVNCGSATPGCMACGACALSSTEVLPLSSTTVTWSGKVYSTSTNSSHCACYIESIAAPGKYRATVSVYSSGAAATGGITPGQSLSVDFDYPDSDGIVTIAL